MAAPATSSRFANLLAGSDLGQRLNNAVMSAIAPATAAISRRPEPASETELLTGLKQHAWDMARAASAARADAAGLGADAPERMPTLTDYLVAARSDTLQGRVSELNAQRSQQGLDALQWTPRSMVNFSGMELRDIRFQRDDFRGHTLTAEERESLHMTADEVAPFYAEVEAHITCDDTKFYNVHFHPADTLDDFVKTKTGNLEFHNVTFDGLDREVNLTSGLYEGVNFVNIHGTGHIVIGDDSPGAAATQIMGMDISSVEARLSVRSNAVINGLTVDDSTRIMALDMQPGATLINAEFGAATLTSPDQDRALGVDSPRRSAGVRFDNVTFRGTNLRHFNFDEAELTNVNFDGADLQGVSFAGVTVRGSVTINGQELSDPHQIMQALVMQGAVLDHTAPVRVVEPHNRTLEAREEDLEAAVAPAIAQPIPVAELEALHRKAPGIEDPHFGQGADLERAQAAAYSNGSYANPDLMAQLDQMRNDLQNLKGLQMSEAGEVSLAAQGAVADLERPAGQNEPTLDRSYFARMSEQG